jgi:transposase-like protein
VYYDQEKSIETVIKTVFETILNLEREEYLATENNENNKGNGYYSRMARSINQYFQLKIPRDRLSLFKPVFLETIKQQDSQMQDLAFKLYTKGLTTRDIGEVFEDIYGKSLSPTSISNITKEFQEQREAWLQKPINDTYYFIYIDALYIPIRRDTVTKEAFYTVLGLRKDLRREVLGVYNIPTETLDGWHEVFCDLKNRGLKQTLLVIADGIKNLESVIKRELPEATLQKCLVHKIRNILLRARTKDKYPLSEDFKEVFELGNPDFTMEMGIKRLKLFIKKWGKIYPGLSAKFEPKNYENYFAYLNFPYPIHRMIYTTNWIERLNKSIRRTTDVRNSFPNPDSALNLICAYLMDYEKRVYSYPVTSFLPVKDTLDSMFVGCPQTQLS